MSAVRVHWLQHVPFEGLGSIRSWLLAHDCRVTCSRLYADDALPDVADFDWLIVMGGPMNVDDHAGYAWLVQEKQLIRAALDADKRVLGICLGAQLIARALGAEVVTAERPEIGWFPVILTKIGADNPLFADFTGAFPAFHWHGDRFSIPAGARHCASSQACANQAFSYGPRVLALQFHLETTAASASALTRHCADELIAGKNIQTAAQLLADPARFVALNRLMDSTLARLSTA